MIFFKKRSATKNAPYLLTLANSDITITVEKKRIKHIYIRIHENASVTISAPLRATRQDVIQLVNEKTDWIKSKVAKHKARAALSVNQQYQLANGETHHFLGNAYRLVVNENALKNSIQLIDETMQLNVKTDADKSMVLEKWYRQQFISLLPELSAKWQTVVGKEAKQWRIKRMKTRWGTCNIKDKRIWLNLALIRMPIECIEYVIVHELVHLWERGHNRVFYSYMDQFMPQWQIHEKTIQQYQVFKTCNNN